MPLQAQSSVYIGTISVAFEVGMSLTGLSSKDVTEALRITHERDGGWQVDRTQEYKVVLTRLHIGFF